MNQELIKVFVGCSANGEDAESQSVLEYTLRKHASQPVEIEWMKMSRDPNNFWYVDPGVGGWKTETWATPFSGFRWGIPERCNFEGKAIYMDSDMIIQDDIAKLWNQEFKPGKVVMAKGGDQSWRYCVALWNNAAARDVILPVSRFKAVPECHQRMMGFFSNNGEIVQSFENNWNCIDGEDYKDLNDPDIKIIHYSDMSTQPHIAAAQKRLADANLKHWFDGVVKTHWRQDLIDLFEKNLAEAIANGYPISKYIPNELYGEYNKESQKDYAHAHQWSKT